MQIVYKQCCRCQIEYNFAVKIASFESLLSWKLGLNFGVLKLKQATYLLLVLLQLPQIWKRITLEEKIKKK
jgi:hypothetical protein